MRLSSGLAMVAALVAGSLPAWAQDKGDLPIRGAALYTSGVGYFLHEGKVDAGRDVVLDFRSSQINDVLKSLVLQVMDGGQPGMVVYPSRDPMAKTLGKYQIDLSGAPTLSAILAQLRGTSVTVRHQGEAVTGLVLGVEQRQIPGGEGTPIAEWVLNLSVDGGLMAFSLRDVTDVKLLDDDLKRDLDRALGTLDKGRRRDSKPVTLTFPGEGTRDVRLGYVIETPVWKTSYRLVLPEASEDKDAKAHLQGWAIVENQTENDWTDLTLSLVSGRPISFQQDLYSPLYASRPVVRPKLHAGVAPRRDEGGVGDAEAQEEAEAEMDGGGALGRLKEARRESRALQKGIAAPGMFADTMSTAGEAAPAPAPMEAKLDPRGVQAAAQAEDLGELFRYVVANVSLPRQSSAMIPIVASPIDAEKVSVYNPAAHPSHPLSGVLLSNTTGLHLMNGPVTLFEANAYGGDALLDDLPGGQHRLLTYAVDLESHVLTENKGTNAITTGSINRGVLRLKRKHQTTRIYKIQNKGDRDRLVLVEHGKNNGFDLKEPAKPFETTDQLYRFKVPVAQGKTEDFHVVEERIYSENISLTRAHGPQLAAFARNGALPETVRAALNKAASYWEQTEGARRAMETTRQRIQALEQDQGRVRENLRRVQTNSSFYQRMMKKMASIESEIEDAQEQAEKLREEHELKLRAYQDFLAKLVVE